MLMSALGYFGYFVLSASLGALKESKELLINTSNGAVQGRYMKSNTGHTIRAFMGIPFAEPPVNDLRFKPPKKKQPWYPETLLAQTEPPKCTQLSPKNRAYEGQEDCLYLNVYAPQQRNQIEDKKFPVMVWFHGGSMLTGHGGISEYGPDYFLDADVILVSGNYRLGAFGFLSTEDENLPGNYGLKDQVAVLKWVQENIEAFGGDNESVTIFGESSGGASVNYHMISPMSQNLFHRAISQSGTLQNFWGDPLMPKLARERAAMLAKSLNCTNVADTREIVNCLRAVDAIVLQKVSIEIFSEYLEYTTPYLPVMESSESKEEPFITLETFKYNQRAIEIPWLVGINSEEGAMTASSIYGDGEQERYEWIHKIPKYTGYDHLEETEQREVTAAIKEFYFKNEEPRAKHLSNVTNLLTDGGGYFGMFDVLESRWRNSSLRNNTFVYLYSHKGASSFTKLFDSTKFFGTCHMDELLNLFPFYESKDFYTHIPTDHDRALQRIMPHLWANFARTGTPNNGHINPLTHSNQYWPAANGFPLNYMRIGNDNGNSRMLLEARVDLYPERVEFWRRLKEKYMIINWKL